MKIVQQSITKLKAPASGNQITWDSAIPGFGVRITAAGAVAFVLDYYFARRKRRITIGRHPEWNATTARAEALELRRQISQGEDPLAKREQTYEQPMMSDLCSQYVSEYAEKNKRAGSIRNDKGIISNIVIPRLGQRAVSGITRRDIEALHKSLKPTPYHANRVLSLLSKVFELSVQWGYRTDNPVRGVKRYDEQSKERWLASDELQRFSAALDAYRDQNAADALRLLMLTGSREQEALSADWSQFDLERGVWTKPSAHTKQKRVEHVPLNDQALQLLQKMHVGRNGDGPLFPGRADGTARVTIRKVFVAVCKSAGLAEAYSVNGKRKQLTRYRPTLRIHDLRHSFAAHLVSAGVSLPLVGRLLGHVRTETTARYSHFADESLRQAANRFPTFAKAGSK